MDFFEVNNIKLSVKEDNEFIAQYGIPKGLPCAVVSLSTMEGFDGDVRVTSGFYRLSEESQRTMLTHEAGHVACGHLQQIPEGFEGLVDNSIMEAEADAWADSILGNGAFDKFIEENRQYLIFKIGDALTPELIENINSECEARIANRKAWIAKNS